MDVSEGDGSDQTLVGGLVKLVYIQISLAVLIVLCSSFNVFEIPIRG